MSRVCIIGMGWLGVQVAQKLKAEGHEVLGTVSSSQKQQDLIKEFDSVITFDINDYAKSDLFQFQNIDYYILTIPPSSSDNYSDNMRQLIAKLLSSTPKAKLIYTSSSSVYGSQASTVSEESETQPETNNGLEIVKIEQHLINQFENRSIILRLGGLVGKDRHPVKYLSGRSDLKKGNAPVNLVHADDICDLVAYLFKEAINSGVYNVCSPDHPTKKEYYSWAAKQLNLPLPNFDPFDQQLDKIVNANAIKKINFEMNYKSPYDFPITS